MTIRVAVHRTCDRCAHPFDESSVEYGKPLPKFPSKKLEATVVEDYDSDGKGHSATLFCFKDLCPDCDRVVAGYISKIRLDEDESPKRNKKDKKDKSEPKSEEKPVEETKAPEVSDAKIVELPGTVAGVPVEETKAPSTDSHQF